MSATMARRTIGVVGGMGPLASAAFVQTLYERAIREREQEGPAVLLVSDPSVPDRTEALPRGREGELLAYLRDGLSWLVERGADPVVVCCVTAHPLFSKLPPELLARARSVVDQVFDDLAAAGGRHLLLCTSGARQLRIFEDHPRWREVRDRVALPGAAEQERVHRLLYGLKLKAPPAAAVPEIEGLLAAHGAASFIAGCTELHLVTRHLAAAGSELPYLDPLTSIADALAASPDG